MLRKNGRGSPRASNKGSYGNYTFAARLMGRVASRSAFLGREPHSQVRIAAPRSFGVSATSTGRASDVRYLPTENGTPSTSTRYGNRPNRTSDSHLSPRASVVHARGDGDARPLQPTVRLRRDQPDERRLLAGRP